MGIKEEVVGKIGSCELKITTDAAGKTHFEAACLSKEDRNKLAAIFDEEAILRVTPKAFVEEVIKPPVTES